MRIFEVSSILKDASAYFGELLASTSAISAPAFQEDYLLKWGYCTPRMPLANNLLFMNLKALATTLDANHARCDREIVRRSGLSTQWRKHIKKVYKSNGRKSVHALLKELEDDSHYLNKLCAEADAAKANAAEIARQQAGDGCLSVFGRRGDPRKEKVTSPRHEKVPVEVFLNWQMIFIEVRPGEWWLMCSPEAPMAEWMIASEAWTDLRFEQPSTEAAEPTVKRPVEADAPPSSPAARMKPTAANIENWFKVRLARWPDEQRAPTEKDEWLAFRHDFGDGVSRDDFRLHRDEHTPPEWRTQGPRRSWGAVNTALALKSANLPPQN